MVLSVFPRPGEYNLHLIIRRRSPFPPVQIPFSLTLRSWDLYLLEGERVMIGMAYNILRMHRRFLMKQGMDELIEHLQINLEKDFGYEDDVAIDKLREVINELASNRLDLPGRPPSEELPQKPFGLAAQLALPPSRHQQQNTLEREIGYRTGFSEKEREFSVHAIQRQIETESRARQEPNTSREEDYDGNGKFWECGRLCKPFADNFSLSQIRTA